MRSCWPTGEAARRPTRRRARSSPFASRTSWRRRYRLERRAERVARGRLAALVADGEPVLALARRSVRPRFGIDPALCPGLDPVVADRGGGVQAVGDVVLGQVGQEAGLRRVIRPDPREAVGLELRAHRASLCAGAAGAALQATEQVLNVVTVLVGEHVSLSEGAAGRAEAVAQVVEETEVDVDLLVQGAVEGADVRARDAAARVGRAGEEDGLGDCVVPAVALELIRPVGLEAVPDADDAAVLARVRCRPRLAVRPDRRGRRLARDGLVVEILERPGEVAASGEHGDQEIDRERDEAQTAPADRETAARQRDPALTAPVLDLRRIEAGVLPKAHRSILPRRAARQT